jgi:L-methionine (R)-S-oxide reductase
LKRYRSPRELLTEVERLLSQHRLYQDRRTPPLEKVLGALYQGRHYFWIGIYFVLGDQVVRQAFRGPVPPCRAFALGKGNVGTTGQSGVIKVVPDVTADPTYSMCFLETKSEIVVPVKLAGRILGVIDVESDQPNAFGKEDEVLLKRVAQLLARFLTGRGKIVMRHARERHAQAQQARPGAAAKSPERVEPAAPERALAGSVRT